MAEILYRLLIQSTVYLDRKVTYVFNYTTYMVKQALKSELCPLIFQSL